MPELPEVETMRRGIAGIVGRRIRDVLRPKSRFRPIQITPALATLRRRVVGCRVVGVGRVGKRVVIELDSGERIVIEPRMAGRVLLAGAGDEPDREHVRLVLEFGGTSRRLVFWDRRGLGVVWLMSLSQFAMQLGPEKIGPDALEITVDELRSRLGASRRAIKVAILDQKALAGVGNLYASEILHRAHIHPQLASSALRPAEWRRLCAEMHEVLDEAIRLQGSTLADGTYRTAGGRPGSFQERHRVYQRAGQTCLQCGKAKIIRLVQAQRSTFYCPRCQRDDARR